MTRFWVPDSARVQIRSLGASNSGYVLAGVAISSAGARAGFLAFLDQRGAAQKIVRTVPFETSRVAVCSDGNVWAMGEVPPPDGRIPPEHNIVQRFDLKGKYLDSSLPLSSFPKTFPFHPGLFDEISRSHIRCSGTKAIVVSAAAKQIVVLDSSGVEAVRIPLANPERGPLHDSGGNPAFGAILIAVAAASDGTLYAEYTVENGQPALLRRKLTEASWSRAGVIADAGLLVGMNNDRPVIFSSRTRSLVQSD